MTAGINFGRPCSVEGCAAEVRALGFTNRCPLHDAIAGARNLSPEDFDRLREALSTSIPLTDEDRRERRARAELRGIEWRARDLKRGKDAAREAGATPGQIASAVERGEASK